MSRSPVLEDLARADVGEARLDEPMGPHTTWRIGGPADLYVEPRSVEQAARLLRLAGEAGVPVVVIGEGSNILFDDAGVRGIVLRIGRGLSNLVIEGTTIRAQAGVAAARLAREAARVGAGGVEHIGGIPGSLGGLIVMNGGARGHNIGESVREVEALDRAGHLHVLSAAECGFTYRHSRFQETDWVVVGATLDCTRDDPERLFAAIDACVADRRARHPMEWPNCGSVFTNGAEMLKRLGPAGQVIESAGLKGARVGDAEVSEKHANFIVNRGAARSADVLALIGHVRETVRARTGFVLECEVRYVAPDGRNMAAHEAAAPPGSAVAPESGAKPGARRPAAVSPARSARETPVARKEASRVDREKTKVRERVNYAVYFTGNDVVDLLVPPEQRQKTLDFFEAVGPSKYYLECSKIDEEIRTEALRAITADLTARGIAASGALVPIHTPERRPLCYSDPEDMEYLEHKVRHIAESFDEIIVDDWLFTVCTCPRCVDARGGRTWAEYRQPLLVEAGRRHILEVARRTNPRARVIVKFPNWVEGHARNGYDAPRQAAQFDGHCVGIETRMLETQDQHFPIYSGYFFLRWFDLLGSESKTGSWLDNHLMRGFDDDYLAQVVQAVLGDSREVILWSGGWHYFVEKFGTAFPTLVAARERLDRLQSLMGPAPRGIPTYVPYGADGEYNLPGYLGMIGLPIEPVVEFPEGPAPAIFTRHAAADPQVAGKIVAKLRAGADVMLTWPLLRELMETELGQVYQIFGAEGSVTSDRFRHNIPHTRQTWHRSERPLTFPAIRTTTWPYVRRVAAVREDGEFLVFGSAKYLSGTVHLLNVPENQYDLFRLPTESLDLIRRVFAPHLGVALGAPSRVAHYPFGESLHVLHNQQAARASVTLTFPASGARQWRELLTGRPVCVETKTEPVPGAPQAPVPQTVEVQKVSLTLEGWEVAAIG